MGSSPFICRTSSGPQHLPEPQRDALRRWARRLLLSGAGCPLASVVFHPEKQSSREGVREPDPLLCLPFPAGSGLPTAPVPAVEGDASSCSCNAKYLCRQLGWRAAPHPGGLSMPAPAQTQEFMQLHFHDFSHPPPSCEMQSQESVCASALGSASRPVWQPASVVGAHRAHAGV